MHFACNPLWYEKNNIRWVLDLLKDVTAFMPAKSTIRERLYYVENNLHNLLMCTHCNTRPIKLKQGNTPLKSCGHADCLHKIKSTNTKINNDSLKKDSIKYNQKIQKLRNANKGKLLTDQQKQHLRNINLNKKQSEDTIKKRIESRRGYKHSAETIKKIRQSNIRTKKERGPRTITKEYREKKSAELRARIANGTWTPHITNTWTRWKNEVVVNGITHKFRSSWELAFWLCNMYLKYEITRIPYTNVSGKSATYIVDFTDDKAKILYEVKPTCNIEKENTKQKTAAALEWCKRNEYTFQFVTNKDIKSLNILEEYKHLDFYKKIQNIKL